MKKYFYLSLLILINFTFVYKTQAQSESINDEIIGIVNDEKLYLKNFNRLFNAQKKKYKNNLHYELFSRNDKNSTIREEEVKKAKTAGVIVSADEFNNALDELINKYQGIENLDKKAKETNLTLSDIKKKVKENILLDKYFDKTIKDRLLAQMITEVLILQEAKARNIQTSEEEITKRLNSIKEKQGGEEKFKAFLAENNATIEDAKNEIKNQMLFEFVKELVKKETPSGSFNEFLSSKKSNANIVIYHNKVYADETNLKAGFVKEPLVQENNSAKEQKIESIIQPSNLRTKEYPIEEQQRTSELVDRQTGEEKTQKDKEVPLLSPAQQEEFEKSIKKRQDLVIEEVTEEGEKSNDVMVNQSISEEEQEPKILKPLDNGKKKKFTFKKSLKEKLNKSKLTLIPGDDLTLEQNNVPVNQPPYQTKNLSKEIQELRRKIEQRRVTTIK